MSRLAGGDTGVVVATRSARRSLRDGRRGGVQGQPDLHARHGDGGDRRTGRTTSKRPPVRPFLRSARSRPAFRKTSSVLTWIAVGGRGAGRGDPEDRPQRLPGGSGHRRGHQHLRGRCRCRGGHRTVGGAGLRRRLGPIAPVRASPGGSLRLLDAERTASGDSGGIRLAGRVPPERGDQAVKEPPSLRRLAMKASNCSRSLARLSSSTKSVKARLSSSSALR